MRRSLIAALAVPVLLLSACGSDEPTVEETTADTQSTEDAAQETTEDTAETEDPAEETTDDAAETEDPAEETSDDAMATDEPTEDDAAGGDTGGETSGDSQAAADRTKEWLVAFVNGEEAVCDYMLDLDSEGPMKDDETDYSICTSTFPGLASEFFDAETAGIIESMEINGADVDGDTAVVNKNHFSAMFSQGMGDEVITLKKVDGEWYVDMNASF